MTLTSDTILCVIYLFLATLVGLHIALPVMKALSKHEHLSTTAAWSILLLAIAGGVKVSLLSHINWADIGTSLAGFSIIAGIVLHAAQKAHQEAYAPKNV